METFLLIAAAFAGAWLVFFGVATLIAGITADTVGEFPLVRHAWTLRLTGIALLVFAPAWFLLIPGNRAALLCGAGFLLAGLWFLWRWRRLRL